MNQFKRIICIWRYKDKQSLQTYIKYILSSSESEESNHETPSETPVMVPRPTEELQQKKSSENDEEIQEIAETTEKTKKEDSSSDEEEKGPKPKKERKFSIKKRKNKIKIGLY